MALSAEQARHTENVFHIVLRQRETHLVCLSCSAESATEALSLALHSVPRVFHLALRRCRTHSQCVSLTLPRAPLKLSLLHSIVFHSVLRQCETPSQCKGVQER